MLKQLILAVLVIFILGFQHFLSTRERIWLGSIFPIGYVIVIGIQVLTNMVEIDSLRSAFLYMLGLLIFLGIWADGRNERRTKKAKEAEQMNTHDIK